MAIKSPHRLKISPMIRCMPPVLRRVRSVVGRLPSGPTGAARACPTRGAKSDRLSWRFHSRPARPPAGDLPVARGGGLRGSWLRIPGLQRRVARPGRFAIALCDWECDDQVPRWLRHVHDRACRHRAGRPGSGRGDSRIPEGLVSPGAWKPAHRARIRRSVASGQGRIAGLMVKPRRARCVRWHVGW